MAETYFEFGWIPFPLPAGEKFPPPDGRTGRGSIGNEPGRAGIAQEARTHAAWNIGTRMPVGVLGIDVDAYDGKPGAETLADLYARLGVLPDTPVSTSRDDGVSGIRFYRVPGGIEFVTKLPGIEFIQPHHRYAVVEPSAHPKTGRTYRWTSGGVPKVDELPELPPEWLDHLRADGESNTAKAHADAAEVRAHLAEWLTNGEPCQHIAQSLLDVRAAAMRGEARHDSAIQGQLAIIRWAEAGHPGGGTALDALEDWFRDAIGGDRDVTKEWHDGVQGAVQTVLADRTPEESLGCPDTFPEDPEAFETDGEDDDAPEDEGRARDGREKVNVRNRDVAARVLREKLGTGAMAGLFHREGELVHTPRIGENGYQPPKEGQDDGPAQVRIMTQLELKTWVEVAYSVGVGKNKTTTSKGDDGEEIESTRRMWESKMLPNETAANVHTAARRRYGVPNLRTLAGVTHTPVMRPDGTVVDAPGYDAATRLLYLPEPGLVVPAVPESPTDADVRAAVELVLLPFAQFPFVSENHRANYIGALFTPLLRPLLPPPYPAIVITAPSPGSGKGYLAYALRTLHGGIIRAEIPRDDTELGKTITAILTGTTAPVVTFDNVRGKLHSPKLEGLLTAETYSDRFLGQSRDVTAPNDRLWTITGNNAEIGGDLARRCVWVTIDPRMPRPHERQGFVIENFKTWISDNRGALLHAMLTIARAWVLAGRPAGSPHRSDDYTRWSTEVRGLLSWAGFPGVFGEPDPEHTESADDQEWADFVSEVHRVFGDRSWKVKEIAEALQAGSPSGSPFNGDGFDVEALPGDLADKWARQSAGGFIKSLSWWIKNRAGRFPGNGLTIRPKDGTAGKRGADYRVTRE